MKTPPQDTRFVWTVVRDVVLIVLAVSLASLLRGGPVYDSARVAGFGWTLLAAGLSGLLVTVWRRTYRPNVGFLGMSDLLELGGVAVSTVVSCLVVFAFSGKSPASGHLAMSFLAGFFSYTFLVAVRMPLKSLFPKQKAAQGRAALIVGAGGAGDILFRELRASTNHGLRVLGFVDDDPKKIGGRMHGLPVYGPLTLVKRLVDDLGVTDILVAVPSASPSDQQRLLAACAATGARVRMMPSISMLVAGDREMLPIMRRVDVEDLLQRRSVETSPAVAARYVSGETVLITGGGGSIGSELARQVAALSPANLVLLGKGENSIFEIEQELRHQGLFIPTPVICDVRDRQAVETVFRQFRPTIVFHAAAHKHVPLMEAMPVEAVRNNVFGTLNLAEAAVRHGVKRFILVSTDKAVNPGNVMGATKRVAEMVVGAMSERSDTRFAAVRFGNVLGSRGSLIPILRKQIERGGPVTITHPDMTRYFMTIPEAAQLIVQAGAAGSNGDVFILDMGEPVKIIDVAYDLVRKHGLEPGRDIEIKYIGVRPGEKMHEELSYAAEEITPCENPKILRVSDPNTTGWAVLRPQLDMLAGLCDEGDADRVRAFLLDLAWGKNLPPVETQSPS
ncbi:MAG: polysaccharide biosynthesis protein [Fimbriimonadaceae bacterium]|nr:polysaccharide biosynthesis protein [Fimbriimonadaceae bacterium]